MSEQNMTAVRACFEQASRGNYAALEAIVTSDFVLHTPDDVLGARAWPRWSMAIAARFPTWS